MSDPTIHLPPANNLPPVSTAPAAAPLAQPIQPIQPSLDATTDKDAQIAQLQAKLAAKEQAEQQAKKAAAEKANADFAESLATEGKIAPAHKGMITAVLNAIDTASQSEPLNFGEGDQAKPLSEAFKETLSAANASTYSHLFSEAAGLGTGGANAQAASGFDAPSGTAVDADRLALHQQALTYAEAHKVDYATAVSAIGG